MICLSGDKPSENFKVMDIRESAQVGWETISKPYLLLFATHVLYFLKFKGIESLP